MLLNIVLWVVLYLWSCTSYQQQLWQTTIWSPAGPKRFWKLGHWHEEALLHQTLAWSYLWCCPWTSSNLLAGWCFQLWSMGWALEPTEVSLRGFSCQLGATDPSGCHPSEPGTDYLHQLAAATRWQNPGGFVWENQESLWKGNCNHWFPSRPKALQAVRRGALLHEKPDVPMDADQGLLFYQDFQLPGLWLPDPLREHQGSWVACAPRVSTSPVWC